jgi:hypothetical protein
MIAKQKSKNQDLYEIIQGYYQNNQTNQEPASILNFLSINKSK